MFCKSCARDTLQLFIRTVSEPVPSLGRRAVTFRSVQQTPFSSASRSQEASGASPHSRPRTPKTQAVRSLPKSESAAPKPVETKPKEPWRVQKESIKEKLGGEAWNPRKRLSPDTMEGIRHLHQTQPHRFTTPVLAQHFKVSPEAIRRILKSKWRPSDEETEDRLRRWDRRGERIWSNLVEMGVKPPKRWREMGVGRGAPGEKPLWKSKNRNTVPVNENPREEFSGEDLIPIVDGKSGKPLAPRQRSLSFGSRIW